MTIVTFIWLASLAYVLDEAARAEPDPSAPAATEGVRS